MSQQQNHIHYLYDQRGKNDPDSTTLANTLDKDIQTVFNSPDKFIMELLQNADDATNQDQYIDVNFQMADQYLLFSHTGKHFDKQDVDAICDSNAQQDHTANQSGLNKTGYKGIGFKSVFVISECVYILSDQYSFRFDRQRWNLFSTSENRYPWQIIPIWTDNWQVPKVFGKLNDSHVNFIFHIKQGTILTVHQAVYSLLSNPYTILFLRHIRQITISMKNQKQYIELKELNSQHSYQLCINEKEHSRWFMISKQQQISAQIRHQLQDLNDHQCPLKLKNATCDNLQFAVQLDSNHQVKPINNSKLFCYLPTQVHCQLPFLINANFLLSADRVQLLSNIWNAYLFQCIAQFHIESLQMIAQMEQYRDNVLTLFTDTLTPPLHQSFIDAYKQAIAIALDEIAFIPSYLDQSHLLKWHNAVTDNIQFFNRFPSIDPSFQTNIANYTLKRREKINKKFTQSTLASKIHDYATQSCSQGSYEELLAFLITTYSQDHSSAKYYLTNKVFLLTINDKLVSNNGTFLPLYGDRQLQQFLSDLNANFIHSKLLNISGSKSWLESMGINNITDDVVVRFFEEWMLMEGPNKINEEMFHASCFIVVSLLSKVDYTLIKTGSILEKLPLMTKSQRYQPAEKCYLPSVLHPKFDVEKITGMNTNIVDDTVYSMLVSDKDKLRSTLISLKVKQDVAFFCGTFSKGSDSSHVYCFDQYYDTYIKDKFGFHGKYSFHIAYLPYMQFLKTESYAKIFFKYLHQNEDDIIKGMTNFKPCSRSNRGNYSHDHVDHYLKFILNREPCVQGQDDQLYRMKDLYITSIVDKLDDKLKRLVPQIKFQFDNNTAKLSDQLMILLGAQQQFSYQDIIKLLNAITDEDADRYYQIFQGLYKLILRANWKTISQVDTIQQNVIKLLASDQSRQYAASLHSLNEIILNAKRSTTSQVETIQRNSIKLLALDKSRQYASTLHSFRCQYIRLQHHPNLFHSFPDISKEDELKLCRLFGVQVVESQHYIIHYKQIIKYISIQPIKHLLKMIVITVANLNSIKDMKQLLLRWMSKLEKLQIKAVEGLTVQVVLPPCITFKVEAIISADQLYCKEELPLAGYINAIAQYIELPLEQMKMLQQLCLFNSDQEREQHLNFYYYDISAIRKLDHICLLQEDLQHDADLSSNACNHLQVGKILPYIQFIGFADLTTPFQYPYNVVSAGIDRMQNHLQDNTSSINSSHQRTVQWGEKFAYQYFIKYYEYKFKSIVKKVQSHETTQIEGMDKKGNPLSISLTWSNYHQENNHPFDMILIKNGRQIYMQIKSTDKSKDLFVKISHKEWICMCQYRHNYRLCCIYNAGMREVAKPIIKKIKDPASKFFDGTLIPKEIYFKL